MSDPINDWIARFDAAVKRYQDATSEQEKELALADIKLIGKMTEGDALYWVSHRSKNTR